MPNQFTGGEGAVTGEEVQFNLTFTVPFTVGADHIFFRPEVDLGNAGDFLWLSAPKPIVAPGTPFAADLQSWIRTDGPGALAPDWERIGTDVTHQGPFNAALFLIRRNRSRALKSVAPGHRGNGAGGPASVTVGADLTSPPDEVGCGCPFKSKRKPGPGGPDPGFSPK